jgi:hypothetical protein
MHDVVMLMRTAARLGHLAHHQPEIRTDTSGDHDDGHRRRKRGEHRDADHGARDSADRHRAVMARVRRRRRGEDRGWGGSVFVERMARVLATRIDEKQRDVFTGKAVVEELFARRLRRRGKW